jgi:hypothetical protein
MVLRLDAERVHTHCLEDCLNLIPGSRKLHSLDAEMEPLTMMLSRCTFHEYLTRWGVRPGPILRGNDQGFFVPVAYMCIDMN